MRYQIILSAEAVEDLNELKPNVRSAVCDALETHLRYEPEKTSKSRIKRLRGYVRPEYRLRVGDDVRVFYDVAENVVEVIAIVLKSEAEVWLERCGESDEAGGTVGTDE